MLIVVVSAEAESQNSAFFKFQDAYFDLWSKGKTFWINFILIE